MNKKGSIFIGVAIGLFIYVVGILFIPFIMDDIDTSRTSLDCGNTSITDGTKTVCLMQDLTIPYFIWFIVSFAIGIIAGGKL